MRWKVVCVGLAAALAVTAGCKQQCFVSEAQLNELQKFNTCALARDPAVVCKPVTAPVPAPATVLNPDRKIRYISLAEAISIALEQGNIGNNVFSPNPGLDTYSDSEVTFNRQATDTDSIRVLSLNPATTGAQIDLSLSKFDANWVTSMAWSVTDVPVATAAQAVQAGGTQTINTENATLTTSIFKPLPTGGVAGITFDVPYTLSNVPGRLNPAYTPALQFAFEQPLLQGFGVEINQLRQSHPGSLLLQNAQGLTGLNPGVEGILVTRIRFDQQRAEFQREVNIMLANVEFSYWNLYNAYWNLYANDAALRQAYEAWKISIVNLQVGKITAADVAQTRGQYELFRFQRLEALGNVQSGVLERERQLRGMLGMPVEDGCRLVPSDSPTLAAYQPDWCSALNDAMNNAPSLIIAREEVKVNQMNLRLAENALLPDFRFGANYDINGIGDRLDGPKNDNAFRSLSSDHFNNWSLNLRLNVPLGYRAAYANVRLAKLNLARSYASLETQELKVQRALARSYQNVFETYEQIKALRAQREAFGEQVKARFEQFQAGKITPDLLLEAQRFWANALSQEYQAIRDYNNSLAVFELVKGTIPQHDNVVIAEAQLPGCVAERAVEHQRQRSIALEARERAAPVDLTQTHVDHPIADVPVGPDSHAAPLPELWQSMQPLRDAPALPAVPGAPAASTGAAAAPPAVVAAPVALPKQLPEIGTARPSGPALPEPGRTPYLPGTAQPYSLPQGQGQ